MSLMDKLAHMTSAIPGVAAPVNPPAQGIPGHPIAPPSTAIPMPPSSGVDPAKPVQVSARAVDIGQIVWLALDAKTSRYAKCISYTARTAKFVLENGTILDKKDTTLVWTVPIVPTEVVAAFATPVQTPTPAAQVPVAPVTSSGISLYINCIPSMPERKYLDAYVDRLTVKMCETFEVPDIRLGKQGSALAYGGWRGVLASAVRAEPPPPGAYVIFSRDSEIMATVAEALIPLSTSVVRGIAS